MQTIFVIGSNSFSGASFVDYLLEQGNRVVGISRSSEPHVAFLPYSRHLKQKFEFHKLDLNLHLPKLIDLILELRPDYVVNFAAQSMVAESWLYPADWFITNAVTMVKLHDELRKMSFLKRYVHISTPEVYGSCYGFVCEDHVLNPSTPYAVSRAAADMSLKTFRDVYKFPVVTTRAANVYGPGQQLYRIIPRTILFILLGRKLQLHGGGESTRSFIHIRDVSEATWIIAQEGKQGCVYHISTKEVISIRYLVEKVCMRMGVSFEEHVEIVGERMGKDAAYQLDSTKLRQELGWQDKISLNQGIDECIQWVTDNISVLKEQPFDYIHKA